MRWLKKILRIIAIILPAFCLFIGPGVSAKKYEIDSFSQHGYSVYAPNSSSGDGLVPINSVPQIWVTDKSGIDPRKVARLKSYFSGAKCIYQSDSWSNSVYTTTNSFSWGYSYIPATPQFLSNIGDVDAKCRSFAKYNSFVGSVSIPEFSSSNVPFAHSIDVSSVLPYNFMYNNLYFNSVRESDGKISTGIFYASDLLNTNSHPVDKFYRKDGYNYYDDRITRVSFPLNFDSSKEMVFSGSKIIISGMYYTPESDLNSSSVPFIESRFIDPSNYSPYQVLTTCIKSPTGVSIVEFSCEITVPNVSTFFYGFNFILNGSSNYDDYSTLIMASSSTDDIKGLAFDNFTITLNNDDSNGGNGGFGSLGSFPNVSPGTPDNSDDSTNWFDSIKNLFTFNLFNPFAAIFNMFNDNDSCTQIPILAGMLHSNDTEYCPWFDVSTRNILTPVIGFSSMMLLFGFVISWLKSSSGNFLEDGSNEPVGYAGRIRVGKGGKV